MVTNPDKIVKHKVKGQCKCGKELSSAPIVRIERKQVFDLPEKLMEVTEHQVEVKQCSCGVIHAAECKEKGNVQYGYRIKSLAVYLNQYQFIPFERLQEMMEDCFGVSMSDGVLAASNEQCYEALEKPEEGMINCPFHWSLHLNKIESPALKLLVLTLFKVFHGVSCVPEFRSFPVEFET